MIGGGTGLSAGSNATTCTPGKHLRAMLRACDALPVNVGLTAKGCDSAPGALREQEMLMLCHYLSCDIPEVAFAESRIRAETIAAEDVLHDTGAISIMSSDSQAMGRCGEVVLRTWNTAHKNKLQRGPLGPDAADDPDPGPASAPEPPPPRADNFRVSRYVSKYTINPAVAQGIAHLVGSVEIGKLADLVLWDPAWFGTKPELVLKGGFIAWAQMGDPNASIPTVQPIVGRPMFAPLAPQSKVLFVS